MEHDYEIDETPCPRCGHAPTNFRECTNFCDEGYFDAYDEDPINYVQFEQSVICEECWGTGIERWCPNCALDINRLEFFKRGEHER